MNLVIEGYKHSVYNNDNGDYDTLLWKFMAWICSSETNKGGGPRMGLLLPQLDFTYLPMKERNKDF